MCFTSSFLAFIWNSLVLVVALWLQITWLGFLFGSVLGVVLLLIFAPAAFFLPLALLGLRVETCPPESQDYLPGSEDSAADEDNS